MCANLNPTELEPAELDLMATPARVEDDVRKKDAVIEGDGDLAPRFSSVETEVSESAEKPNVSMMCRILQFLIPLASVIGGSLIGPFLSITPPAKLPGSKASKAFLLSTWRFGPLAILFLAALPLYVLYERCTRSSDEQQESTEKSSEEQDEEQRPSNLKLFVILLAVDICQ